MTTTTSKLPPEVQHVIEELKSDRDALKVDGERSKKHARHLEQQLREERERHDKERAEREQRERDRVLADTLTKAVETVSQKLANLESSLREVKDELRGEIQEAQEGFEETIRKIVEERLTGVASQDRIGAALQTFERVYDKHTDASQSAELRAKEEAARKKDAQLAQALAQLGKSEDRAKQLEAELAQLRGQAGNGNGAPGAGARVPQAPRT